MSPSSTNSASPPPAVYHREFTLGHEVTGWVEEVGSAVEGFEKGDAYLVYGPLGCGRCSMCVRGEMLQCRNRAANTPAGIGLGRDGGMAENGTVPARNLVPLGDAAPIAASALADAGLPPYHAIKKALLTLKQGGQCVLVIGLGGLGLRVLLADRAARNQADFHLLGHPARAARAGQALPRRLPRANVHHLPAQRGPRGLPQAAGGHVSDRAVIVPHGSA